MTQPRLNAAFVVACAVAFVVLLTWAGYLVAHPARPAPLPAVVVTR